jgi:hypothetical protein
MDQRGGALVAIAAGDGDASTAGNAVGSERADRDGHRRRTKMGNGQPIPDDRRRLVLGAAACIPLLNIAACGGGGGSNPQEPPPTDVGDFASGAPGPAPRTGAPADSPDEPGLPSWASETPVWQWKRIPGTNLSRVDPRSYVGATGPSSKISAWCGAGYSRLRRAYIIAAAGGHGDYANNEVNVIRLGRNAPAWEEVLASSPVSAMRNGVVYEDGRRSATHSYWGTQYIERLDRTFLFQCYGTDSSDPRIAGLPSSYPASNYIMAFSHAAGDWDPPDRWARWPNAGVDAWFGAFGCQNVLTGTAYVASQFDGGTLRKFDPDLNSWSAVMQLENTSFCAQAVDPARERVLQVGSYDGTLGPRVIDLKAKAYAAVSFTGLGAAALTLEGAGAGMVFDELNDCFYVFPGEDAALVLRVRAADWHVDRPPVTGPSPGRRENGWQNAWQYDPALKGMVCAIAHEADMVYLRTSA